MGESGSSPTLFGRAETFPRGRFVQVFLVRMVCTQLRCNFRLPEELRLLLEQAFGAQTNMDAGPICELLAVRGFLRLLLTPFGGKELLGCPLI